MKRPADFEGRPEDDGGPLFARARASDPDTSKAAAASLGTEALDRLSAIVLGCLNASGESGCTTVDIASITGIARDTLTPRMPGLVKKGLVYDSGERRKPIGHTRACIVWKSKA